MKRLISLLPHYAFHGRPTAEPATRPSTVSTSKLKHFAHRPVQTASLGWHRRGRGQQVAGVVVTAGHHAFPSEPPGGLLRLSYAMLEPEWVDTAARTVADAIMFGSR